MPMPKTETATRTRRHRPLLAIAAAWAVLVAGPRTTHPGLAPPPPTDSLAALVAALAQPPASPPSALEIHSVRAAVAPHDVRLPVDKNARHPGHVPVAVSHDIRLGSPARALRLATVPGVEPEPVTVAVAVAPPVPARPQPDVKTPSPGRAAPAPAQVEARPKAQTPPPAQARAQAKAPIANKAPAAFFGKTILVAGDSLSLFLADALRPMLANRPQTAFASRGKVSSGLARPDFFNWEREMASLAAANRPDTVIIMIATNDNQTMTRPDGSKVAFGRPGWDAEYSRRVNRLVELARKPNPAARIFWLGAPVMADPKLNADVAAINSVIARALAATPGCRFIDVSRTLADAAGRYTPAKATADGLRATRTKDGVHLTPFGAKLLASATLASLGPNLAALPTP
ncbi:SGNH/GDSL hydrolase family protein [Solidesulfovibrio sp.]